MVILRGCATVRRGYSDGGREECAVLAVRAQAGFADCGAEAAGEAVEERRDF